MARTDGCRVVDGGGCRGGGDWCHRLTMKLVHRGGGWRWWVCSAPDDGGCARGILRWRLMMGVVG